VDRDRDELERELNEIEEQVRRGEIKRAGVKGAIRDVMEKAAEAMEKEVNWEELVDPERRKLIDQVLDIRRLTYGEVKYIIYRLSQHEDHPLLNELSRIVLKRLEHEVKRRVLSVRAVGAAGGEEGGGEGGGATPDEKPLSLSMWLPPAKEGSRTEMAWKIMRGIAYESMREMGVPEDEIAGVLGGGGGSASPAPSSSQGLGIMDFLSIILSNPKVRRGIAEFLRDLSRRIE